MAEVSPARTGKLVQTLFQILQSQPDGLRAADALAQLADAVSLSEYEAGNYASGGRRFERIVRFATVTLVKAGWMVKQKGVWSVTEDGNSALRQFPDPEQFFREAKRLYRQWRRAEPEADEEDEAAESSQAITLEQAEEWARSEIEEFLAVVPPYEFQTLVGELLSAMGYHVGWEAPPGKDGGVDLMAFNDPIGSQLPRIKVQVKRNAGSSKIDAAGLRSFMALLSDSDVGVFVALSGFTRDADAEARQSHRRITLIDAEGFVQLWIAHHAKLSDTARRRFPLRPVWFLAGDE